MKLQPEGYIPRILDRELERRLKTFGAVEVAGTMWCGKTWTSMARAESIARVGLHAVRLAAEADPATALIGERPHVIDEWQDVPAIWDAVRMEVDMNAGKPGQFILTGSSQPNKDMVHHSGAGRISKLHMRTMSLAEMGVSSGSVSLAGLFRGEFEPRLVQQTLAPLAEYICQGGWPALMGNHQAEPSLYLDSYFDALFDVNIPRKGLRSQEARYISQAIARNQGNAVKLSTLAADARFDLENEKASKEKVSAYINALQELYVLEAIAGWDAPVRAKSRLRVKPKYYFTDPSMTARLLGITPERLLQDGQLFGVLFENLCIHDLLVYTSALPEAGPGAVHYYRDSDGLEVDVIIELNDGRWAGIEIKLGENKAEEGIASLLRLKNKVAANPAARNPDPSFLAVLTGAGEYARYDKKNGVYILPLTALGV